MTTRDRAALVLAVSLGLAVVLVVVALYVPVVRFEGPGLSDAGLELLLGIVGALIAAVGATFSREVGGARALIALVLAATLGAVALVVVSFAIYDAVWSPTPGIGPNTAKVLSTLFGGMVGALLGYLGVRGAEHEREHDREQESGDV